MERRSNWKWTSLLLLVAVGCSSSTSAPMPSDPAAQAAYDFLDAVLKGDTQRASSRLTPLAMERITLSGKQFAPPGLETASFRIGEVRRPTETQALVQCILTDASADGQPRTEEIGCLLRLVGNDWRVSGIAYVPGPNRPPMILNFENPQQEAVSSQQPMALSAEESGGDATSRPSPPRTAQEAIPAAAYR